MKPAALLGAGTAVCAVLALSACGGWDDWEYTPASGTVTELEYEPAEYEQDCGTEQRYNAAKGKYESTYVCHDEYVAECYEVDFQTPEGEILEECTTEEIFEGLEVGAVYVEGMDALATHTPWLTPSPSPSVSPSG